MGIRFAPRGHALSLVGSIQRRSPPQRPLFVVAVRQMGGVNGGPGQTLEQKKKLLWGAKKAESVQLVGAPAVCSRASSSLHSVCFRRARWYHAQLLAAALSGI